MQVISINPSNSQYEAGSPCKFDTEVKLDRYHDFLPSNLGSYSLALGIRIWCL